MQEPVCELGYTTTQLEEILGDRLEEFWGWFRGQTGAICDGRRYEHSLRKYFPTGCGPHGPVVYAHDLRQFLDGGRALD